MSPVRTGGSGPGGTGGGRRHRGLRLTASLLRDDATTLAVLLPVLLAACWAADWSTPAVGAAGVAALVFALLTGAVVVTRLVPHVAAGGHRADLGPALLVRGVVIAAVLTGALAVLEVLRKDPPGVLTLSSSAGPVVDALRFHGPHLALVTATGASLGAGLVRWGAGTALRLPLLAAPLLAFGSTTSTRPGLLLWVGVVLVAVLVTHLLLRGAPLHPGAPVGRARIGTAAGLLLARPERGAPA